MRTIDVFLNLTPSSPIKIGRLAEYERRVVFEWARDAMDIPISPLSLKPREGLISAPLDEPRLHGVFADALPDAWGRLLIDRALRKAGRLPEQMNVLDRLLFLGDDAHGALSFEPGEAIGEIPANLVFDDLANEAAELIEGDGRAGLDKLVRLGGSSGGARPKVHMFKNEQGEFRPNGGPQNEHWIVKFGTRSELKDGGAIEAAYSAIARAAGLKMAQTELIPSELGAGWFATKRFDRAHCRKLHFLSLAGALNIDFRIPSIGYETLLKACFAITRDIREVETTFRAMVFNIVMHNRDDHSKNFGFLMDEDRVWRFAPSYDLTFNHGPSGEHSLDVAGEGRAPMRDDILKVAKSAGLKDKSALDIIDEVNEGSLGLGAELHNFGVSHAARTEILGFVKPV